MDQTAIITLILIICFFAVTCFVAMIPNRFIVVNISVIEFGASFVWKKLFRIILNGFIRLIQNRILIPS